MADNNICGGEQCAAGLRTVANEVNNDTYAGFVARAMVLSAADTIAAEPDIKVRDLTHNLADGMHSIPEREDGERNLFIWGPIGPKAPEHRSRKVSRTDITTERLALAVAACAVRDCPNFQKITTKYQQEGGE